MRMRNLTLEGDLMREIQNPALKAQLIATTHFVDHFSFDATGAAKLLLFPAQSYIVRADARPAYLFYLVRGKAKLYHPLANGKVALINFFTPPCFIGEMELIDPTSAPFNMQALTDCYCLALPIAPLHDQLLHDAMFLRHICTYLARKNVTDIQTATQNQSFTLTQRLAAFILMTAHDGLYTEKHTQVAEYLGVSYRHLLYVIARFVDDGLLSKVDHHYHVTNEAALRQLAAEIVDSSLK